MNKYRRAFIPTIVFFTILFLLLFFKEIQNSESLGRLDKFVVDEMPAYWRLTPEELANEEKKMDVAPVERKPEFMINTTKVKITRQELGRQTWTLLHMISGNFPDTFDEELTEKTNVFLNLFAQFYPCKLCGTHLLGHLKNFRFTGRTKVQFMHYMCDLHNIVNLALGHPTYDCKNIVNEWNFCGCSTADAQKATKEL